MLNHRSQPSTPFIHRSVSIASNDSELGGHPSEASSPGGVDFNMTMSMPESALFENVGQSTSHSGLRINRSLLHASLPTLETDISGTRGMFRRKKKSRVTGAR